MDIFYSFFYILIMELHFIVNYYNLRLILQLMTNISLLLKYNEK